MSNWPLRVRGSLLLLAALASACHSDPKPEPERRVGWRPIVTLSGTGPSQSESFNIETGQWRIKWSATNEKTAGTGTLRVMVHSAVSGRPLVLAIDHKGTGHDTAVINEDPRLYHLVIESGGLDWSLAVEEAVVGY